MQIRYDTWIEGIKAQHGSIVNYLVNIRLGWQDRSVSPSDGLPINEGAPDQKYITTDACPLPTPPPTRPFTPSYSINGDESSIPKYFTSTLPSFYVKILPNDWPYSIPLAVKHFVFWSKVPIIHPGLVHPKIWEQVGIDGLWGFTGSPEGRTRTPRPNKNKTDLDPEEEESLLKIAHHEVELFVKNNWNEDEWETAWFVNPPRLQSIPGLAHGHVFARRKDTPTV
ncbi:hypothetical protein FRC02_006736 [Tulasnella sp. 418]|nr:hypothetical protein FRC02_006736 [Tulasnella sp. 418]